MKDLLFGAITASQEYEFWGKVPGAQPKIFISKVA